MDGEVSAARPASGAKSHAGAAGNRTPRWFLAGAFGLSGAAALIYEVTWTRELSLVLGSTVYGVSLMLGAFMAGLALGGAYGGRWADRSHNKVALFAKLEFGVAMLGLLSIPALRLLPDVYLLLATSLDPHFWLFLILQGLFSFAVMVAPTALMGATFPVVASAALGDLDEAGSSIGTIYSVNTLGAMVGALAGGFVLVPLVGIRGTVFVAAGLNLSVSLGIMWRTRQRTLWRWGVAAVIMIVVALGGSLAYASPGYSAALAIMGRAETYGEIERARADHRVLFDQECEYGEVQVLVGGDGQRTLTHGACIEGSDTRGDMTTQLLLALVPSMTAADARRGFVVGLGTGYTTRGMLSLPYEHVETVEISRAVEAASRCFVGDVLDDDSRWVLHIDDARSHLVLHGDTYDVVTSEPSWPFSDSVANLFTLEFFEIVRDHLNADGVFCQWIPRYLLEREDFMMMYHTFSSVFPANYVWAIDGGGDILFVGVKSENHAEPEVVESRVMRKLEDQGLGGEVSFSLFAAPQTMADSLTDPSVPLNTDDRPLLQFRALRNVVEWNALH